MLTGTFRSYFGAICIPVLDKGDGTVSTITHEWADATGALGGGLAITIVKLKIRNYRVDIAKEKLVEMALRSNVNFLLFIDDDVIPPPDGLMKMIKLWKSNDKYKIINGVYWSKSDPSFPLIFNNTLKGSFWDWKVTDLIQADAGGAGFTFIDADVFRKMSRPWFNCNYYFDHPKIDDDLKAWGLADELTTELVHGDQDQKKVDGLIGQLKECGKNLKAGKNVIDAESLVRRNNSDNNTTEDLYFYKKAKEELGIRPWFDCSIQCMHQDKTSGRMYGLQADYPQAIARYADRVVPEDKIVLDLGSGEATFYVPDGKKIKVDIDPNVKPDIIADVRFLNMFNDCFADVVFASHIMEHFSYREVVSVLREWVRVLKVNGKLMIIVPNLKWASKRILDGPEDSEATERTLFMFHSSQFGDVRRAYSDSHRSGYTSDSMKGLLSKIEGLSDIKVYTSNGTQNSWYLPEYLANDDMGYNIIAIATKKKHTTSISLRLNLKEQKEALDKMPEKYVTDIQNEFIPSPDTVKSTVKFKHDSNNKRRDEISSKGDTGKGKAIKSKSRKQRKDVQRPVSRTK